MTKFQPGFYRMRNGQKAEVLAVRGERIYGIDSDSDAAVWTLQGQFAPPDVGNYDLIEPWNEPVEMDCGWMNIYRGERRNALHHDRVSADRRAYDDRIDCRHIKYVEGKGIIDITEETND